MPRLDAVAARAGRADPFAPPRNAFRARAAALVHGFGAKLANGSGFWMQQFDGFRKTGSDDATEARIVEHCARFGVDPLNAIKLFPVLARRQWLKRFLAHSDL